MTMHDQPVPKTHGFAAMRVSRNHARDWKGAAEGGREAGTTSWSAEEEVRDPDTDGDHRSAGPGGF